MLVVKVTDWWSVSQEVKPSTAEDPPYSKSRCSLNMSRFKHPPVGVVWKLGGGVRSGVILVSWPWSKSWSWSPKVLE
ncbi:hypothetical protein TNCV_4458291 [Trichonephila clavipes]|nr:hypothetical protein TNCV_4458291 [Trichonephila clavipes]